MSALHNNVIPIWSRNVTNEIDGFFRLARRPQRRVGGDTSEECVPLEHRNCQTGKDAVSCHVMLQIVLKRIAEARQGRSVGTKPFGATVPRRTFKDCGFPSNNAA